MLRSLVDITTESCSENVKFLFLYSESRFRVLILDSFHKYNFVAHMSQIWVICLTQIWINRNKYANSKRILPNPIKSARIKIKIKELIAPIIVSDREN